MEKTIFYNEKFEWKKVRRMRFYCLNHHFTLFIFTLLLSLLFLCFYSYFLIWIFFHCCINLIIINKIVFIVGKQKKSCLLDKTSGISSMNKINHFFN